MVGLAKVLEDMMYQVKKKGWKEDQHNETVFQQFCFAIKYHHKSIFKVPKVLAQSKGPRPLLEFLKFRQAYLDLLHQDWVWSLVLKIYLFFLASSLYCFWSFSFPIFFSFMMLAHSSNLEFKNTFLHRENFPLNLSLANIILFHAFLVILWKHSHQIPISRLPKSKFACRQGCEWWVGRGTSPTTTE